MGCCGSRERERAGSIPVDEETVLPAELARNLKDVPEEGSYPTSSDEEQNIVPHDRRPRLSLIPKMTSVNKDAASVSKNCLPTSAQARLPSTDIIDAHMGVHRADSTTTDRRRSQWEAVALGVAARKRSQDVSSTPESPSRVAKSPTADSPGRKRRVVAEQDNKDTSHKRKCLTDISTCPADDCNPQNPKQVHTEP